MKRWLIALAVLLVSWFALKDHAYQAYLSTGSIVVPPALSYESGDHWVTQPETPPPGAWETPWGIDAFIILPPANVAGKHGLLPPDKAKVVTDNVGALAKIGAAIPGETPAYAPFYRQPSPANRGDVIVDMQALATADILSAFEIYLAKANNGRGIILVMAESAAEYANPVLDRLQSDELSNRFAGLVSFGSDDTSFQELTLICADILDGACHQRVTTRSGFKVSKLFFPSVRQNAPAVNVVDPDGVSAAIKVQAENVTAWLDETQPKLAEPFYTTEIIQDAPIFRPGSDTAIDPKNE